MYLKFWKAIYWIRYKLIRPILLFPKKIISYQIHKTTLFEKAIFLTSFLIGIGLASDRSSDWFGFASLTLIYGNFLGWVFFGSWRWIIRTFTPNGS